MCGDKRRPATCRSRDAHVQQPQHARAPYAPHACGGCKMPHASRRLSPIMRLPQQIELWFWVSFPYVAYLRYNLYDDALVLALGIDVVEP